jgi:acetyl esterase/lipase
LKINRKLATRVVVVLIVGFGSFCLMIDRVLAFFTPGGDTRITRDVVYGPGERGMLDIYQPADARGAPVVVFFYGGSWQMGNRGLYEFVGKALARRGIVTIVPDYRLYPEIRFPEFLKDAAKATAWAKQNAARFGGDPRRILVMGHSAGAHIASMLSLDPQWLGEVGLDPKRDLAGFVGLAGPYDFGPLSREDLIDLFGGKNVPATHPINFVTSGAPPAFLAAGRGDTTVKPDNTTRLAERLRANGTAVTEKYYPGGHFRIILAFIGSLRFLEPVAEDSAAYVNAARPSAR